MTINPDVFVDERLTLTNKLDVTMLMQIGEALHRLATIEHAHIVGDDYEGQLAGVDPIETRAAIEHLMGLRARMLTAPPAFSGKTTFPESAA